MEPALDKVDPAIQKQLNSLEDVYERKYVQCPHGCGEGVCAQGSDGMRLPVSRVSVHGRRFLTIRIVKLETVCAHDCHGTGDMTHGANYSRSFGANGSGRRAHTTHARLALVCVLSQPRAPEVSKTYADLHTRAIDAVVAADAKVDTMLPPTGTEDGMLGQSEQNTNARLCVLARALKGCGTLLLIGSFSTHR